MTYTCEHCGADAGPAGVHCDPCGLELVTSLLASEAWCDVAVTRTGDRSGETLLQTMIREFDALRSKLACSACGETHGPDCPEAERRGFTNADLWSADDGPIDGYDY